ncbi:MAG TPA: glycosyltransferase [Synergistales bacterium]|nr:glycosyltransferase [Synergistales bacterium]
MKPVNLFYINAGEGHRSAAEAIGEAFEARDVPHVVLDMGALSNSLFRYNPAMTTSPFSRQALRILKGIHNVTDQDTSSKTLLSFLSDFDPAMVAGVESYVRDNSSHNSICTHFFPAYVLSEFRKKDLYRGRIYMVVTDYGFHKGWFNREVDKYFVTSDRVRQNLAGLGVENVDMVMSGVPVRRKFREVENREDLFWKNNLDKTIFNLLILTNGISDSIILRVLDKIYMTDLEMNLMVVTGKNQELLHQLAHYRSNDRINFHRYGFIDNLHEMMGISDLLLTKPGSLTVSEAFTTGTPLLMFRSLQYQETYNADYVEEKGSGIMADSEIEILDMIRKLYFTPQIIETMRSNAKKAALPFAAETIVETILGEEGK